MSSPKLHSLHEVSPMVFCILWIWTHAMTKLDSVFKNKDITLLIKVCLVKAMVFLVVMYGCESWTIK